jgi:hypothetical protein
MNNRTKAQSPALAVLITTILFGAVSLRAQSTPQSVIHVEYLFKENKLCKIEQSPGAPAAETVIAENVLVCTQTDAAVCYVANKTGDGNNSLVVTYFLKNDPLAQKNILAAAGKNYFSVLSFQVVDDTAFLHVEEMPPQLTSVVDTVTAVIPATPAVVQPKIKTLFRVTLSTGALTVIPSVEDFYFSRSLFFVLRRENGALALDYNGTIIPSVHTGEGKILNVVDDRIVFVGTREDADIVDLRVMKSVYRYGPVNLYKVPEEYNLILEMSDQPAAENISRNTPSNYYRIYIDGVESGRTVTGPSQLAKQYTKMLEADAYHLITVERWDLVEKNNRYERAHNISQPTPMKIYIPTERILKIVFICTDGVYAVQQGGVVE